MSHRAGDVRPGKCFATAPDKPVQVRRVRSVAGTLVVYEARVGKGRRQVWSSPVETSMEQFLEEAAREVGCDYTG